MGAVDETTPSVHSQAPLASWPFAWSTRLHGFGHLDTVRATLTGLVRTALCPLPLSVCEAKSPALLWASCSSGSWLQLLQNLGLLKLDTFFLLSNFTVKNGMSF